MKMNKNIDLNKSLEQLENDYWPVYNYETSLIEKCHNYRKLKLKDLNVEHIRILIGQNIGNKFLIPLAIKYLTQNILSEGDFFEGDLLLCVLKSDKNYWINNKENYFEVINLINKNLDVINNFQTTNSIRKDILESIDIFKKIQ